MPRVAFKMKLFKGCEEEYKRRHDELWPELEALLKEAGIRIIRFFLMKKPIFCLAVLTLMIKPNWMNCPINL